MNFFDQYDRFYTTSKTSPAPHRLNGRYAAIIDRNRERLDGKRVLDIASHDGRWSFAALQAGAAHVTGIEPRQELIANATETFAHYGIDEARYRFVQGDVFDCIQGEQYDVVLCLGFYYHTVRHAELLNLIERTGAELVVIDTEVAPGVSEPAREALDSRIIHDNPYQIQLLTEPVANEQMAFSDSLTRNGRTLVGRPNRAVVRFMADHFGFHAETYDWSAHLTRHPERKPEMPDYAQGWRDTFYLSRQA